MFPWRPAILSPTWILRRWAIYTRTTMFTPGPSSSPFSRVKTLASTMMPLSPWGTFREVSPDLPGLLAEDGPQQPLLSGEVGLALGGDLAHQDIAGADLRADAG